MKVAVIGGGAAGFFAAISAKTHHPSATVHLLEKSSKVLSKVRISGGGRCNVCHDQPNIKSLSSNYPRGERFMRAALHQFGQPDTVAWFESRGVELKTEEDGRMFPITDQSESIITALIQTVQQLGVQLRMNRSVDKINPANGQMLLQIDDQEHQYDRVIVAAGGHHKPSAYQWLKDLGITCVDPVPSLFTFNIPHKPLHELMGVAVPNAQVRLAGTNFEASGPLLITHWGMSGPAVLRVSAFAARYFHERQYKCSAMINWTNANEDEWRTWVRQTKTEHPKKLLQNTKPASIPQRLWLYLLQRSGIDGGIPASELNKKSINRLVNHLCHDTYEIKGKTTFKEEFVTAGGVDLGGIHQQTMESKVVKGLYFAGEILDIDGVTGGFNFQAAWTTGFIAGQLK